MHGFHNVSVFSLFLICLYDNSTQAPWTPKVYAIFYYPAWFKMIQRASWASVEGKNISPSVKNIHMITVTKLLLLSVQE